MCGVHNYRWKINKIRKQNWGWGGNGDHEELKKKKVLPKKDGTENGVIHRAK